MNWFPPDAKKSDRRVFAPKSSVIHELKSRIVGIAFGALRIEGGLVGGIERCLQAPALRKALPATSVQST